MTAFVVDASVTAVWLLPGEDDDRATAAYVLLEEVDVLAPALWWFEARNVLIMNERRGRISRPVVDRMLSVLAKLPIKIDHGSEESAIFRLARQHRLTVYDAAYLELAKRRTAPLATLDKRLLEAAAAEGVGIVGA